MGRRKRPVKKEEITPATARLTGHTDFVKCLLTTSLQGRPILISGGADATIIVWDLTTGKPLHKLKGGHVKAVQDLAIDPLSLEGTAGEEPSFILFTASSSPEIRRWYISRSTAHELPESLDSPIRAHDTSVYKLRFDSDGDLWTASADKTAKHLVRSRGWEVDTSLPHPDFVRDVVVHEEAGLVATGCRDEEVRVWDAAGSEGEVVVTYSGHFEEVTGLGLVDGGRSVVSVSIDGTTRKWSLERKGIAAFLEEVQREKSGEGQVKSEKEKEGMLTAEEEAELAESKIRCESGALSYSTSCHIIDSDKSALASRENWRKCAYARRTLHFVNGELDVWFREGTGKQRINPMHHKRQRQRLNENFNPPRLKGDRRLMKRRPNPNLHPSLSTSRQTKPPAMPASTVKVNVNRCGNAFCPAIAPDRLLSSICLASLRSRGGRRHNHSHSVTFGASSWVGDVTAAGCSVSSAILASFANAGSLFVAPPPLRRARRRLRSSSALSLRLRTRRLSPFVGASLKGASPSPRSPCNMFAARSAMSSPSLTPPAPPALPLPADFSFSGPPSDGACPSSEPSFVAVGLSKPPFTSSKFSPVSGIFSRVCGAAALSFSMRASIAPVEPGLGGASLVGDVVLLAACALIPACLRRMLASLRRQVSSRIMFFSWDFCEDSATYLIFLHEVGQLAKELPPSIIILVIVTKESQNVVENAIHLVQVELKLFGLPPSLLHMTLDNLAYSVVRMKLGRIAQITSLLASEHTADVVLETFVLRVLLPDHAFDVVHQGGLIVRVLYHSKPCERRKLETNGLLPNTGMSFTLSRNDSETLTTCFSFAEISSYSGSKVRVSMSALIRAFQ
ncbi:hypothetical protein KC367_g211 [Hortaea werneckii]|nr:hypothetical protein KC367_g211 [Hortaea werneckii]